MRLALLLAIVILLGFVAACQLASSRPRIPSARLASSSPSSKKPDFVTEIKPIFQARCQPCHFQGGKVYDQMPFDKPETITRLGTKLFTRITDEKERTLIRQFLEAP
ncbi:MAG TPA: hypothetical protein VJT71_15415 [Pyrinomonadaceae bacterium]|nr:hypothetical protein [Pyrinomonadaceae bacterium]